MNRLHVRLSLAFIGVVLLVVLLPFAANLVVRYFNLPPPGNGPGHIIESLPQDVAARLQEAYRQALPRELLRFALTSAVVGIGAGIWMSRSLTAPLGKLAEAAKAIGARDLSRRVVVTGSDEIMAVAQAFNDMAADLERAETLRRSLLADVAHELRTPISVIQGNLRAILDDVYPLDKAEVARLYDQTRHLTRLVNDLHELAQAEAHQLALNVTEVDVVALVKETAATFRPIAETADVSLRVELLGNMQPLARVRADRERLTQSLHNLLDNALRHTPAGGLITVQVEPQTRRFEVRVQDNGEGISAEHLPHIFDRFYRTDHTRSRDTGGTGLGLAIVRAIIEAHGGQAIAASEGVGQGSTFTIRLPLKTASGNS